MSKIISLVALSLVSVLFSGCGGSENSNNKVANGDNTNIHRPNFERKSVLNSQSYLPTGSINELNPTFTWPVATNATDYEIGHQKVSDGNTWESFYATAAEANCSSSVATPCSFKSIYTFSYGEERVWWIRSKVGGIWQDWTSGIVFSVNKDNSPVPTLQTILPFGIVKTSTPSFTWKSVANANEYLIGYLEENTANSWEQFSVLASSLQCQSSAQDCTFTPPANVFKDGDDIEWWMRVKVAGNLGEWSSSKEFTVDTTTVAVGIPTTLAPVGTIATVSPVFTWSAMDNATEYNLSYEISNKINSWEKVTIPASSLQCQSSAQDCTFTLPANTFENGDVVNWWMNVNVANSLGAWAAGKEFTVSTTVVVALELPTPLSPIGSVNTDNPIFKWSAVPNATGYKLGYERSGVDNSWEEVILASNAVNCQTLTNDCTFSFPTGTFKADDDIVWFVKATNAAHEGGWTSGTDFLVNIIILPPPVAPLVINEVLSVNTQTNTDPDFIEFSDWIELYNPSNQAIDLSGYGLSDDSDPLQWVFPAGATINPKSYLMVWADDENFSDKAFHTNFKLSSKGELLTLADRAGVIIDSIEYKKQNSDISVAKQNGTIVFMSPTPDKINAPSHASKDKTTAPTFSYASGFYSAPIALVLSQNTTADIFYTLDGSTPDSSSTKYTQAINITQTSVVRAVALDVTGLLSETKTHSYFINHNSTLPIVSLTVDPSYLYDPKIGIYVEGDGSNGIPSVGCFPNNTQPMNYAQDWERPAFVEYFSANKQSEFAITAGISISGECSIELPKKSFSIELDSKYGSKTLKHPLFAEKQLEKLKKFKLRAGGYGFEIGDILTAHVVQASNLNIDYQAYVASQIFVNGEYWGLYNIREKKGKNFITSNYPTIDKDDLIIISAADEVKTGNLDDFDILVNSLFSKNLNLSNDADYQEILATIDEDNYIDYMALMIYTGNSDWIVSNNRFWKDSKNINKWRWMLDDVDSGFEIGNLNLNQFDTVMNSSSTELMILLFKGLTTNTTFRQKFKSRFTELLDTTFSTANLSGLVTTIIDERKAYIPLEESKWGYYILEDEDFNPYVESVNNFVNQRNAIVRSQLDVFIP